MVTSPRLWFVRGLLVGVLLCAMLNALSFFVRSDGLGNLLGTHPQRREALGFPVELWETGNNYGGLFVDLPALLLNGLLALAVGTACGATAIRLRRPLDRLVGELEQAAGQGQRHPPQVSLLGLLLGTTLAAIVATATRYALAGRPEVLGLIYLLGPWLLVGLAFLPLGISWQQRVVILVPTAVLLMGAAIALGASLPGRLEFDKVLMGIFICWTPQSVLAALALTAWLIYRHMRAPPKLRHPLGTSIPEPVR